jgi:Hexameric tyrosine-coordinated heme protein (HTHP)
MTDGSQLAVSPAAPEGNLPVLAALALVVGTATGLLAAIFLLRRVATRAQGAHNGGRGSGIWGILEERITDDLWMPILKTDKPRAGFELGIKLARHGVKATQPSDELRKQLRAAHAQGTTQLIAASQVIATYFQTMAAGNWWR